MARSVSSDLLQDYRFHVFDLSPTILGLFTFALTPSIAFSGVSSPNLVLDKGTVKPANALYPIKYIKGAIPNTIVLQRGASLPDGDFWRWYQSALTGDPGSLTTMPGGRRNLLIAHFSTKGQGQGLQGFNALRQKAVGNVEGGSAIVGAAQAIPSFGILGSIPSRAWLLTDCQPASYKGASDFSATSSAISIREMGLDYSNVTELNLGF